MEKPRDLGQIESIVPFSLSSGFDFHYRLRPVLRKIAAARLAVRHGIDLEAEPDVVRQALGADAFNLLAAPPCLVDRQAPGVRLAELQGLVEALEQL